MNSFDVFVIKGFTVCETQYTDLDNSCEKWVLDFTFG